MVSQTTYGMMMNINHALATLETNVRFKCWLEIFRVEVFEHHDEESRHIWRPVSERTRQGQRRTRQGSIHERLLFHPYLACSWFCIVGRKNESEKTWTDPKEDTLFGHNEQGKNQYINWIKVQWSENRNSELGKHKTWLEKINSVENEPRTCCYVAKPPFHDRIGSTWRLSKRDEVIHSMIQPSSHVENMVGSRSGNFDKVFELILKNLRFSAKNLTWRCISNRTVNRKGSATCVDVQLIGVRYCVTSQQRHLRQSNKSTDNRDTNTPYEICNETHNFE